jgi:NADH-quinone oxidoreductase subunit J
MILAFYVAAAVAVIATGMVITRSNPVHALLYLIVSLLAVAVVFFILGAPFVAALEVIVYAGAIMVLFLFVVMMLNLGPAAAAQERAWLAPRVWMGPGLLSLVLAILLVPVLFEGSPQLAGTMPVDPKEVGRALFGPYVVAVQLAALLLLAAVVGTAHFRRRERVDADQGGRGA